MNELLQHFAKAAREIESLLALGTRPAIQEDTQAVETWILKAKLVLDHTGRLLAAGQPQIAELKSTPEMQHYRKQLQLLKQHIEVFEQELLIRTAALYAEQQQLSRVRSWAEMVGKLS